MTDNDRTYADQVLGRALDPADACDGSAQVSVLYAEVNQLRTSNELLIARVADLEKHLNETYKALETSNKELERLVEERFELSRQLRYERERVFSGDAIRREMQKIIDGLREALEYLADEARYDRTVTSYAKAVLQEHGGER